MVAVTYPSEFLGFYEFITLESYQMQPNSG